MSYLLQKENLIKNNNFKIIEPKYTGNEEDFIKYFENLHYYNNYEYKKIEPEFKFNGNINNIFRNNKTNYQEIINNIGNINSPYVGSDNLSKRSFVKLLKNKKFLTKNLNLFNQIINNNSYKLPKEWSDILYVPRYKKNETHNPKNFRIVGLLNTTTKIFNRIVKYRILDYLHKLFLIEFLKYHLAEQYNVLHIFDAYLLDI